MEGQIKCFSDKVKLKEFIIIKPLLYEMLKGLRSKKKKIKNMNSKITSHNYQQLNLKQKQTKQTTRTGTESQKWRSHGGLSAGRWLGENRGKGKGNKKHK